MLDYEIHAEQYISEDSRTTFTSYVWNIILRHQTEVAVRGHRSNVLPRIFSGGVSDAELASDITRNRRIGATLVGRDFKPVEWTYESPETFTQPTGLTHLCTFTRTIPTRIAPLLDGEADQLSHHHDGKDETAVFYCRFFIVTGDTLLNDTTMCLELSGEVKDILLDNGLIYGVDKAYQWGLAGGYVTANPKSLFITSNTPVTHPLASASPAAILPYVNKWSGVDTAYSISGTLAESPGSFGVRAGNVCGPKEHRFFGPTTGRFAKVGDEDPSIWIEPTGRVWHGLPPELLVKTTRYFGGIKEIYVGPVKPDPNDPPDPPPIGSPPTHYSVKVDLRQRDVLGVWGSWVEVAIPEITWSWNIYVPADLIEFYNENTSQYEWVWIWNYEWLGAVLEHITDIGTMQPDCVDFEYRGRWSYGGFSDVDPDAISLPVSAHYVLGGTSPLTEHELPSNSFLMRVYPEPEEPEE